MLRREAVVVLKRQAFVEAIFPLDSGYRYQVGNIGCLPFEEYTPNRIDGVRPGRLKRMFCEAKKSEIPVGE